MDGNECLMRGVGESVFAWLLGGSGFREGRVDEGGGWDCVGGGDWCKDCTGYGGFL